MFVIYWECALVIFYNIISINFIHYKLRDVITHFIFVSQINKVILLGFCRNAVVPYNNDLFENLLHIWWYKFERNYPVISVSIRLWWE